MERKLMIYGATGYTGRLVAGEAVGAGVRPVLAGRDEGKLGALADSLSRGAGRESRSTRLETRAFGLDEPARIAAALRDIDVVLHCAGPFSRTALPMFEACLRTGTHYVDITGEIAVCEALAARDAEAREAGIMALPAAGFDVVPSDCLIADLAARHPGARVLRLGLLVRSGASRGTMKTALEGVNAMRVRRDGRITRVAAGSLRHEFDFGRGPAAALVTPLADVSTAWWSTGIENIEAYYRAGRRLPQLMRLSRWFGWLLAGRTAQALLRRWIDRGTERRATQDQRGDPGRGDRGCPGPARRRAHARSRSLRVHREGLGGHRGARAGRGFQGPDTRRRPRPTAPPSLASSRAWSGRCSSPDFAHGPGGVNWRGTLGDSRGDRAREGDCDRSRVSGSKGEKRLASSSWPTLCTVLQN